MEVVPARRLAALVGDLSHDRPPFYAALATRLRLLVGDGRLAVGARLPAERDLATALGLSRATVTAAYGRLRDDGWAAARQGSGTWTRLPAGPAVGAWVPAPAAAGVLDLAHAAPSAPPETAAAFTAALSDLPRLLPGHGYHPQGLPELRARIADRFTARGVPTTPEHVLVTGGALHALNLALAVLSRRGDKVLVEHPSYPNALDAITAAGARPVPVAVSADDPGAVAGDLHRAARQAKPRAAYLMPDFQNPTGLLLDEQGRRRLAVGLEQCGVVAVVDETLVDLGLDAGPAVPFAAVGRPDLVVTIGSMSKSFWGGLRVGWLRAEPELVRRCATVAARSQISGPVLEQLAACHLLDAADVVLPAHRARLSVQRDALVAALARRLPRWHVPVPAGGLVLWCGLPGLSSSWLTGVAEPRGLRLAAGPRFGAGHAFDDRLRLPYTQPVDVLERAVELLADIVDDVPAGVVEGATEQLVV
ncbi:MAG TPA: PLP-dependent aminotransferase family protein [Actinomycetales bacterium]|nr:PLP-dependent aminotransferase family protein [Actinomycetales bacterium]